MKTNYSVMLITTPDRRTSERLARLLVDGGLAACVNVIPGVRSRYCWKGKVETAREELLMVKTKTALVGAVEKAVRKAHPYQVCEILSLGVMWGNPAYLRWIDQSTSPAERRGCSRT